MAEKKRGLGRGLSALLGDVPAKDEKVPTAQPPAENKVAQPVARPQAQPPAPPAPRATTHNVTLLSLDQLMPSTTQPRQHFPDETLAELAQSIKEKGVLQPLLVRPAMAEKGAPYEIIAGERRWRAAQKAQLHDIPVIIHNLNEGDSLEAAIVENIQRADLNPIEEAQAYRRLMIEFNYTQDMLAKKLGKSRPYIANMLRLNNVTEKIRQSLIKGQLSAGHARALLGCPQADEIAAQIIAGGLSVRATEKLITQLARNEKQSKAPAQPKQKDANIRALENAVAKRLGLQVDIRHKNKGGGEMRISYKTIEQIENVVHRLMND